MTWLALATAVLVHVTGTVTDRAGKPVEYATVSVAALHAGAATDEQGRFALDLPPGHATLEVAELGYERARLSILVADGLKPLRVTLADQPVALAEVNVAASSFGKAGTSEGAVVRRMDVVTTPGGAADLFQAIRALPGINAPSDAAAIYVRGGPPSETLIRLDGNEIGHPYHYERASGGLFSAFDTYMLKSAFFSSGGFSAKYGGVLSGVLDIEAQDPLNSRTVSVGANLAGGGVSSSWSLIPDRLALIAAVRTSFPEVLFRLYGSSTRYESAPASGDGAARLLYRYSPTGKASLTYLGATDHVASISDALNFEGVYDGHARMDFGALNVSDVLFGKVAVHGQAAGQYYQSRFGFGPIAEAQTERNAQANVDAQWPVSDRQELSFGFNGRHRQNERTGRTLADSTDFQPGAPTRPLATELTATEPGVYAEDKLRLWGPLYATLGGRFDYASVPGTWTADPRAALAWRLDEHQTLRVAGGRYHQLADLQFLDPVYGNPNLPPLEAEHLIAGYEWKSEYANVRVEGYDKRYHHLVANEAATFYGPSGFGYARGVDVFLNGSWRWLTGWVSYGYLDTRRRELDDPRELPSRYDVRHTLTVVGEYMISGRWMIGGRFGFDSGHPWTPVVGRVWDPVRQLWRPIFGENQSAWLPDYHRLDVRVTRLFSLPGMGGLRPSSVCAAYVEALNVLGTRNVLDYAYNADYSERITRESYFSRRLLVAGLALTW